VAYLIIRYSAALEGKLDFNRPARRAFLPGAERDGERERRRGWEGRANAQVECLSIGELLELPSE